MDVSVSLSPQHSVYWRMAGLATRPPRRVASSPVPRRSWHPGFLRLHPAPGAITVVPSAVVPIVSRIDVSVREQAEYLSDGFPLDALRRDLVDVAAVTSAWAAAAREPRRWMRSYAAASLATWLELEPYWISARHLLEREAERVGLAAVRGALGVVLNTLSPQLRYADGAFVHRGETLPVGDRRLILVPSLAGTDSVLIHSDEPDILSIAYPVRGLGTLSAGPAPLPDDRLTVVLGAARARLLRALDAPHTIGAVAAHLAVTPAAASRHCDVLERAGLMVRRRRGQSVLAIRTAAGSELLDLLG